MPANATPENLEVVEFANSYVNGPLVTDPGFVTLSYLASTGQWDRIATYMNGQLTAAQQNLPEGTRVEITIQGWQRLGRSWAATVAGHVQTAYEQGKLVDVDTGRPVQTWPEFDGQLAWGDDAADTVTIRAVKNAIPVIIGWIVIGLLVLWGIYIIWQQLQGSQWSAKSAYPKSTGGGGGGDGGGGTPLPTPADVYGWLYRNWPWLLLGAGGLTVTPFVVRKIAQLREAGNEMAAADRGEY